MWNWADDWGIGDANPKRLVGFAFPNDDDISAADYPSLSGEVARCFDVQFYSVAGREYYAIPSWEEHQRTEKRARKMNPGPDEADSPVITRESERPTPSDGFSDTQPRKTPRGKGEEGTGEQGNRGRSKPSPAEMESLFDAAYDHWPKKVERKTALEKFKAAARRVPVDDLVNAIVRFGDAYAATTERKFVPALGVWISHERWTDDLPTAEAQPKRANTDWALRPTKADQNAALYREIYGGDPNERTRSIPALNPGIGS